MGKNDGGPAFPGFHKDDRYIGGMSLRDYFAAHAPPPPKWWWDSYKSVWRDQLEGAAEHEADWRYTYADAMLKAREAP